MATVAVVGGGIAGLAAAYELTRRGHRVRLFEAASRPGGLIRTEVVDGFTLDAGPDAYLIQKRGASMLCDELGLTDRAISTLPPRRAYVLRANRLHALPPGLLLGVPTRLTALARTSLVSTRGKLRVLTDLIRPARLPGDDVSLGELLRPRLGDEVVDWLVEPVLGGIHGGDIDQLSARLMFPQAWSTLAAGRGLIAGLRRDRRPTLPDGPFRSFPGGMVELVEAIVRALDPDAIQYRAPVASITASPAAAVVLASGARLEVDGILLATPAPVTAELLGPVDAAAATRAAEVPYRSVGSVLLAYRRDTVAHPLDGSGFLVPAREQGAALSASTWVSSKWPGRAPSGSVLLRAFVGGAHRGAMLELDDEALAARAHRELASILGIAAAPTLARVYRWPRASAQHTVGHQARVTEIDARLAAHPRLALAGSGFRATGIADGIEDARAAARGLSERLAALLPVSGR